MRAVHRTEVDRQRLGRMKIQLEAADVDALAEHIAEKVLAKLAPSSPGHDDSRFAMTESQAAERCGIEVHVLREQRRLGRIVPCQAKPGRRILYRPEAIQDFLDGKYLDKAGDNGSVQTAVRECADENRNASR